MFDSDKKAAGLESSTFDILQVDSFHNTRFGTVVAFLWVWFLLLMKVVILASDTYTCVCILVFNHWLSTEYQVYEYQVAKWIFTGCILFRFILLAYQVAWGIHIYRTRNIALAYLNNWARLLYAVRSYNYQCLFHAINKEGFFEWACFYIYAELDDALEVLVADLPRQVINFMTLRYYATGEATNNDIVQNIRAIATTNVTLAIVLLLQLCTLVLFLFFFCRFIVAVVLFIPIKVKVARKGYRLLKDYCYKATNTKVQLLVRRNHKLKQQLMLEGVMDLAEIRAHPLLLMLTLDLSAAAENPFAGRPVPPSTYGGAVETANGLFRLQNLSTEKIGLDNPFASSQTLDRDYSNMNSVLSFARPARTRGNYEDPFSLQADLLGDHKADLLSGSQLALDQYPQMTDAASMRLATLGSSGPAGLLHLSSQILAPSAAYRQDSFYSGSQLSVNNASGNNQANGNAAPYPVRGLSQYRLGGL